jgi:hypothetical protein
MEILNNNILFWFANATRELELDQARQTITNQIVTLRGQSIRNVTTILTIFLFVFGMNMITIYGFRLVRLMFTTTFVELITCMSIICFWLAVLLPNPV